MISIHAPREGSDDFVNSLLGATVSISIHAPREGSDGMTDDDDQRFLEFQSTLPARGATAVYYPLFVRRSHFNPRSPRGERLPKSSTAIMTPKFQSTLPARGATSAYIDFSHEVGISIHAPREGSDNPRTKHISRQRLFQSTLPARGATLRKLPARGNGKYFNPRSPRGERRFRHWRNCDSALISIHAPREGSDGEGRAEKDRDRRISIHAPREGSDMSKLRMCP